MIIWAAVTLSSLKIYVNIVKKQFAILAMPTSITTDAIALNFFSRYYSTIKKLTVWTICESDQNWQNSEQSFE